MLRWAWGRLLRAEDGCFGMLQRLSGTVRSSRKAAIVSVLFQIQFGCYFIVLSNMFQIKSWHILFISHANISLVGAHSRVM